jgi:hypothetical protein
VGASLGAPPLDEECGGAPVRRRQQWARSGLLCKCFWALTTIGCLVLCSYYPTADSQDLKETSRIKSSFIHATRGGWEQLPLLKDKRRLGATPQGLQGAVGTRGGEEGEGGRSVRSSGGLEEGGGGGHAVEGVGHDGRGSCDQGPGRGRVLQRRGH